MKRTTLALDEQILAKLKSKAAQEGRSMQDVANDLLRGALLRPAAQRERKGYRLRLRGWKAEIQPGIDLLDRDTLFDLMDGR